MTERVIIYTIVICLNVFVSSFNAHLEASTVSSNVFDSLKFELWNSGIENNLKKSNKSQNIINSKKGVKSLPVNNLPEEILLILDKWNFS